MNLTKLGRARVAGRWGRVWSRDVDISTLVITGLVPVIHLLLVFWETKTWMAGSSPAMTEREPRPFAAVPLRKCACTRRFGVESTN